MYTHICIYIHACIHTLYIQTNLTWFLFIITDKKVVYKRYASLYFVACVDRNDNELIVLEQIHLFVEVLDRYFGNVCELDIIFNFHKAYYILDELFIGVSLFKYVYIYIPIYIRTRMYIFLYTCTSLRITNDRLLWLSHVGGHLQETSKAEVLRVCAAMDEQMDDSKDEGTTPGRPGMGHSGGRR